MTITDIGILLVVLCVLLWAVMAALHRHTVQLHALKEQLDKLKPENAGVEPDTVREGPSPEVRPISRRSEPDMSRLSETSRKS